MEQVDRAPIIVSPNIHGDTTQKGKSDNCKVGRSVIVRAGTVNVRTV